MKIVLSDETRKLFRLIIAQISEVRIAVFLEITCLESDLGMALVTLEH